MIEDTVTEQSNQTHNKQSIQVRHIHKKIQLETPTTTQTQNRRTQETIQQTQSTNRT